MKFLFALGLAVASGLTGCATAPRFNVSLVNVQFTDATVLESTATFTVRVNNESPESLRIDGAVHRIYLNGLYVGEGLSNETVEVPRLTSGTQRVAVHLNNILMATRVKPILETRAFDYRIKSLPYTKAGRCRADSAGRLDLKDFTPTPR